MLLYQLKPLTLLGSAAAVSISIPTEPEDELVKR
jgi:hypothetical protein